MAKNASYRVQLRRRRAGKTDYQARKAMVVSGRPRLVARPSIKNVTAQIIIAKPQGDQVLAAANSRELIKKYGWKAATGNLPAAYLTGLLCGLKAKTAGVNEAILDIGMVIPTKGSRVFAVLNGVLDAGVEIPHGEEKILHERSKGNHIANYAEELGVDSDEYKAKFSKLIAAQVAPEKIPAHYSKVKAAIAESFKGATIAPEPEEKAVAKKAPAKDKAAPPKEKAAPLKEKAPIKAPEAAPAPVKEKAPAAPAKEAPKAKVPEVKAVEAKAAPAKEEAPAEKAPKAPKAEKAPVKEKAPAKEAKAKAAPKEKAPAAKEKAPAKGKAAKGEKAAPAKEKAPAKKATKKGEKKE
jgi:large subunit ribosomal protein L18